MCDLSSRKLFFSIRSNSMWYLSTFYLRVSIVKKKGEFVSLGFYEKNDLECVIRDLRNTGRVSMIALWGRSMGAVTASLLAHEDPCIAALILDSPFSSLRCLAEELAHDFLGWKVPKFILRPALNIIRSTVFTRAAFNLDDVEPIRHCEMSFIPALFIAAKNDNFVRPHHAESMHRVYGGDKNLVLVEGNHNTMRPEFLFNSICFFLSLCFKTNMSPLPLHSIYDNNIHHKYLKCASNNNTTFLKENKLNRLEKYKHQVEKTNSMLDKKDKEASSMEPNLTKNNNFSSITSNTLEHFCEVEKKKNMTPIKMTDRNSLTPRSLPYNISDNASLTMIKNERNNFNSLFLSGKTCTNISKWITDTLNMTTPDVEPTFCALKEHTSH
ncbi:uncharacterized protein LOC128883672 isoform X2 [Hylaeus volcanicus]|uniref:uncharacterized protein LOC128883672 isoform X2 n=1 Tax=Hylaeus volcanicus TaxID=313075 RepID=UPI0023B7AD49|nr:uncharacterized protein LOC128883672 isoform X2 [Hylaeus volcanicus]